MTEHTECLGEIYHKIRKGDPLTDPELSFGIQQFATLSQSLKLLGPTFHFAWREVNECRWRLEQWRMAREDNRE